MKKRTTLFIIYILILLALSGCASQQQDAPPAAPPALSETPQDPNPQSPAVSSSDVDIDLTGMSSTMVFAEMSNVMWEPEQYVGKTFRIRGEYASIYYEDTGEDYHAVVIADALACCAQGLDFVWVGEHIYPRDYPDPGTEIEVSGVFNMVEEEEFSYVFLETNAIVVVS